ncbi:hypothetical protein B0O80DRAFT_497276 [Mortierella sp. GBAus27b]|nr:hypothetical protein B0O80DRAFT_497276 [Mortierella sp. GBAus27b]
MDTPLHYPTTHSVFREEQRTDGTSIILNHNNSLKNATPLEASGLCNFAARSFGTAVGTGSAVLICSSETGARSSCLQLDVAWYNSTTADSTIVLTDLEGPLPAF